MNCIIIDDDDAARLIVSKLCSKIPALNVIEEFDNAIEAIKFLNTNSIDIVFLDIHMPTFSGFDFLQTIKDSPKIILTTSDRNFAFEAFEYKSVVDYLLKPIEFNRFEKAIQKLSLFNKSTEEEGTIELKTSDKDSYLYVNVERRLVKIDIPEIYLIEAKGDYIKIKTETENYIIHSTLKKIEDKLPSSLFLKVHRSYIINTSEIIDIQDNSVLIKKDVVPVSRANKSELMKRLNLL
jgi:DNA-binding LytR/AlgR family response regulator